MTVSKTQVIGVRMADRAGALAEVLAILRDAKIAVEYAYAFITHSKSDACVVLRVLHASSLPPQAGPKTAPKR